MRTLNMPDQSRFYAPASDECWVMLAKSIVAFTAETYANQFPKFCHSKQEFDTLDKKSFAPVRKSIFNKLCQGPVRVFVDPETYLDAFEKKRAEAMYEFKVHNLK